MKLYVVQVDGDGLAGRGFAIYGEDGTRMKGIRTASVRHDFQDAARLELSLVVNGQDIVFGLPPSGTKE